MRIQRQFNWERLPHWTGLLQLCFAVPLMAQTPDLPAFQKDPDRRSALTQEMRLQRDADRTNALAWAETHGIPLREERDGHVRELMAVWNGQPIYYTTANANAAISTGASLIRQTTPYSVDGSGVTVGVWDSGSIRATHQEFGGRVSVQDGAAVQAHSTHVGGTIAAAGVVSSAKGMAPAVSVDSYNWTDDTAEFTAAAASGPGQPEAVYVSNHSYSYDIPDSNSYYLYGCYTSWIRDMDIATHGAQYCLPFAAAGNDRATATYANGYDTVNLFGVAKNTITVGAVYDAVSGGVRSLSEADMLSFSSWGPTDDGRIKPDIVANGFSLYSTTSSSDTSYGTLSGTSMASPNACGSAALLVDYYNNRTSGGAMLASTLKGLIIHTADDLGTPGPDYSYGWGLMNTLEAAAVLRDFTGGNTNRIVESQLSSTGIMSRSFNRTSSGGSPLRITLCWTDQPGLSDGTADNDRSPDLVNDLNLVVTGPHGTAYYPYKLDFSSPEAAATTNSANSVDNVEQIYIEQPAAGDYTVTVSCNQLFTYETTRRGPRVTETLTPGGTQNYSLIVSGIASDTDGDSLPDEWEQLYFGNSTGAEPTDDFDLDGLDNLNEYIAGTDPTDPDSRFGAISVTPPASNSTQTVIAWESVTNRIYNVSWSDSLTTPVFTNNTSIDLPYPAGSYTDSVERVSSQNFYRLDVRMAP